MKRKSLLSLFLVLSLALSLCTPALAWEYPPQKYRTFQAYLDFYRAQTDEDTKALVEYVEGRLAEGWADSFDADAYFEQTIAQPVMGITKGNWLAWNSDWYDAKGVYAEEWFHAEMLDIYLTWNYRALREDQEARKKEERFQALLQTYPERYAAFDPDAWFQGYYGRAGAVQATYMANWGLDAQGFKREMFMEWADKAPTSFFNGCCVTVDGVPIFFQDHRGLDGEIAVPRVEHDRLLVPLRPVAEALGLSVEWDPETGQVVCAGETAAVTFTLNSTAYSGGTLEAAPYAENAVTYLPLRALGEALGCRVEWDQDFATAALTTAA